MQETSQDKNKQLLNCIIAHTVFACEMGLEGCTIEGCERNKQGRYASWPMLDSGKQDGIFVIRSIQ